MRFSRSLAGQWQFQLDPEGRLTSHQLQPDREIPVPLPWQAAFPELRTYSGYAWYQQPFNLDDPWLAGQLLLDFGAVDYWCQVYVNGACVGEHEGGYTPFRFPIRHYVHPGENTLSVRVYDPVQDAIVIPRWYSNSQPASEQPPFNALNVPHGKQEWYVNVGGIWQDVTLLAVPTRYIERVHVTPNIHTGEAHVEVTLGGVPANAVLSVSLEGQTVETAVAPDQTSLTVTLQAAQPRLWTPETPALYTIELQLQTDDGEDEYAARFGYREITTRDGKLLLNGEPIYLLCALDQDMYPDTIYTVPSDDFLRDQFQKAKHLGLNSLRCHIKPPDPRYLDLADEIGLLIWAEIPSWRTFYPKTAIHPSALHLDDAIKARVQTTLQAMIARDYNHPSLIIWTLVNEDWGTALLLSEADRAWLPELVDVCKRLDPTRLVVDNSPCPAPWGLSVHVKSDLDDFHIYTNIPDQAEQFEQFVEQFGLRPLWSFSNTGDAQRTGSEPIILSEFGNWALPSLKWYRGVEPDWFELGAWWSPWDGEPGYATGVLERFEQFGLNAIWPDYETFAEATQWHAFNALKFEIEALRRQAAIQGYVVTELSDIYWESNGLLDFARQPKAFHDQMAQINTLDMIAPHLSRYAYWDDEQAHIDLYLSHYSDRDWSNAWVRAVTPDKQEIFAHPIESIARGEVCKLGTANWSLPRVEAAKTIALSLRAENGATLTHNEIEFLLLPSSQRRASYLAPIAVITRPEKSGGSMTIAPVTASTDAQPDNTLPLEIGEGRGRRFRQIMEAVGYRTTESLSAETRVLVTNHPTLDILKWVREGGDLLFMSSTSKGSPFFWRQGRGGTYAGNWATSFSWLRPGIGRCLPVSNPLTLPFIDIMPEHVILGLPTDNATCQQDFLAGQISGWVRQPALHTVQFRYGRGRVIMTTYRIMETISYHPIAVALLNDLIEHLVSEACQPVLRAYHK